MDVYLLVGHGYGRVKSISKDFGDDWMNRNHDWRFRFRGGYPYEIPDIDIPQPGEVGHAQAGVRTNEKTLAHGVKAFDFLLDSTSIQVFVMRSDKFGCYVQPVDAL